MINPGKISLSTIGWSLLFMLVLYFPTIHYINHLPIRWWDESLFGLRALHIYKTGDYLSNFQLYDGLMDHRNTKLPFTTWIQVLFMKFLGVKVLALRLPVIMIFLATVAFTLRFAKKNLSAISIGVIFTLVTICSPGIVRDHILRTGDHDMAFLCYLFVMVISCFQYLECNSKKYLGLFAISLIAALLTKNLLAGAFLPGLLLYTIYSKKIIGVLTDKFVWIIILSVVGIFSGSVFYLNETYPGFVDRMWGYELMGRYIDAKDGHKGGFGFFLNDLAVTSFKIYFWMVPLSLLVLFTKKLSGISSRLLICLGIVYFSYILIISFAETKLFWYGTPIIPVGAMMIGIALNHIYNVYILNKKKYLRYLILSVFAIIVFVIPYKGIVESIIQDQIMHGEERFGLFIKKISMDHPSIISFTLADKDFGTAAMWYKEQYNIENEYNINYKSNNTFGLGETVMTCLYDVTPNILKQYEVEVIQIWNNCQLIKIISEK